VNLPCRYSWHSKFWTACPFCIVCVIPKYLSQSETLHNVFNMLIFLWWGVVNPVIQLPSSRTTPCHLPAVHDCLFIMLTSVLYIWRVSPPSSTWGCGDREPLNMAVRVASIVTVPKLHEWRCLISHFKVLFFCYSDINSVYCCKHMQGWSFIL
jgi:hypothetical protein